MPVPKPVSNGQLQDLILLCNRVSRIASIKPTFDGLLQIPPDLVERLTLGHAAGHRRNLRPESAFFCGMDDRFNGHRNSVAERLNGAILLDAKRAAVEALEATSSSQQRMQIRFHVRVAVLA